MTPRRCSTTRCSAIVELIHVRLKDDDAPALSSARDPGLRASAPTCRCRKPPTMPTSSPRLSSKLTSLRISLSLKLDARCCTSRSVTSLAATSSSFSVNWRTRSARREGRAGSKHRVAYRPSSIVDPCEEHREDAVDHDHHENRFHHRGRRLPAERFGRASTPMPSMAAMRPMTSAMNGALIIPTRKVWSRRRVLQAEQEDFGADPAIEESDRCRRRTNAASRRDEGQHRHREKQRDDPRQRSAPPSDRGRSHAARRSPRASSSSRARR